MLYSLLFTADTIIMCTHAEINKANKKKRGEKEKKTKQNWPQKSYKISDREQ